MPDSEKKKRWPIWKIVLVSIAVVIGLMGVANAISVQLTGDYIFKGKDTLTPAEREAKEKEEEEAEKRAKAQEELERRNKEAEEEAQRQQEEAAKAAEEADIAAHGPKTAPSGAIAAIDMVGEQMYPYGFKPHWIVGRISDERIADYTYFIKVKCDITNQYGATAKDQTCEATVTKDGNNWVVTDLKVY